MIGAFAREITELFSLICANLRPEETWWSAFLAPSWRGISAVIKRSMSLSQDVNFEAWDRMNRIYASGKHKSVVTLPNKETVASLKIFLTATSVAEATS